jgi:hypothetical protein
MPVSSDKIRRWIEQSDIDYYTHFIKAWIPFNAWYKSHFPNLDNERARINAVKNKPNPIRNGIDSLLETENQEGEIFKSFLSGLHYELENNKLLNEFGIISFHTAIKEKNSETLINQSVNSINYYLERKDKQRLGEIKSIKVCIKNSTGNTIFNYNHNSYDANHIQATQTQQANFSKLSLTQQENLRVLYLRLTPVIVINAIEGSLSDSPKNYYRCDSYNFKRDTTDSYCKGHYVCKSLIEILYQLRNMLFHGELIPSEANNKIYKNAFFLLKMLIEKIK